MGIGASCLMKGGGLVKKGAAKVSRRLASDAGGKIVQKVERGAAVEVNLATGSKESISSRDAEAFHNETVVIDTMSERIKSGRKASRKIAARKESARLLKKPPDVPVASRLSFRESGGVSSGKLKHTAKAQGRGAALDVNGDSGESDNSGVDSAKFAVRAADGAVYGIRHGYSASKLHPQRAAFRVERGVIKANSKLLYERSLRRNPELARANVLSKALHKRRVKREYARAFRSGAVKQGAKKAHLLKRVAVSLKSGVVNAVKFGVVKKKIAVWVVVIGISLVALVSSLSSCLSLFSAGFTMVLSTSYTAEDEDILGADEDYFAMALALAASVDRVEDDYPGYDEYRYFLDVFGHDPYVLASYLTVKFNMYTRAEVQAELIELFALQYELTLTPVVEIRTRIETHIEIEIVVDPDTGEETEVEHEVEVEYEYHILEVRLRNNSLSMVVAQRMTPEEMGSFMVYMETLGNRPDLFDDHPHASRGEYLRYEIPPDALADAVFAAMIKEAEKYLGWPYVWGGSSPATSFDCSGYVSWVINNSGWSVGRLTARGLFGICTPVSPADARPGDLIFFNYTYAAPQPHLPTHVGIYVGNNMMIHCGNPISYASITTPYWVKHFYSFGRLP